jgi:hypothetical protein
VLTIARLCAVSGLGRASPAVGAAADVICAEKTGTLTVSALRLVAAPFRWQGGAERE